MTSFHVWAFALGASGNLRQPRKQIALETLLFQNFSGFSSFVQGQMFMTRSYLAHLFLEHEPLEEHFIFEAIASQYREKPSHTQMCFQVVVREKDVNTRVYSCVRESLAYKVSYIVFKKLLRNAMPACLASAERAWESKIWQMSGEFAGWWWFFGGLSQINKTQHFYHLLRNRSCHQQSFSSKS